MYLNTISLLCISPDGRQVLTVTHENYAHHDWTKMMLWDITTGNIVTTFSHSLSNPIRMVNTVCFSPDGSRVISGSIDGKMRLWDAVTGKCLHNFEGHTNSVDSVCFSPDGKKAVSGSLDRIKLWDIESGDCIRTIDREACSVRFNLGGTKIISINDNCQLQCALL